MTEKTSLCLGSLLAFLACATQAQAQDAPHPGETWVENVSYWGNGCPAGTAAYNLSPDAKAISFLFSEFSVETGGNRAKKSCAINLQLHVPAGWTYTLFSVDYRGYLELDRNSEARLRSWYAMNGQQIRIANLKVDGPIARDVQQRAWVPLDTLLSEAHTAARAHGIDPARAHPGMPAPRLNAGTERVPETRAAAPMVEADTTYCCAVDRWGNAFSATPSDGSWNSPVVPGLGLIPSNRGSQSRPDPRHPSGVAPGKRPRLTPNPAMVVTRDGGAMPFGTPGGDVQIQAMLQVMLNVLHFGMEVQAAIEAPRVASYAFPSSFAPFEYFPGRLAVETRIDTATRAALAARGHAVQEWPERTWLAGSVEAILTDPKTGMVHAGADPRRPAYAIAS